MSIIAPKGRKHRSADALFRLVRSGFANIPDPRTAEVDISLTDALMSGFAMFSLKSPSLLAFEKERAEGHWHTIYGIQRVPCDTRMREILDPVSPKWLRPVFTSVFGQLQRGKALEEMVFLDGHYVLALDGTGYFSSQTIHCASCLHRVHRHGAITSTPQMLGAAIIHPDKRTVIPLMPEPIGKYDGTDKNDCERHAAKRFVVKLRQDHPHLKFIVTEDSLSSNAPHIETLQHHDLHYILGVKEGDHSFLFQQIQAAEHAGRVTHYARHDGAAGVIHRFRLVNDVPRNASNVDVRVHFIEYWESGDGKVQHCSWVTDLRVSKRNVFHLMRGGRARWKIENETCNTLKNQGYNFEHHYGGSSPLNRGGVRLQRQRGARHTSSWHAPQHNQERRIVMDPTPVFCPNLACPARGHIGRGNMGIHSRKDQRFLCPACQKTFSATPGTVLSRLRTSAETVGLVVTLLAHGCPVQAIVAAGGFDERTVADW